MLLVIVVLVLLLFVYHPLVLFSLFIVCVSSCLLALILAPFAMARYITRRTKPRESGTAPRSLYP